MELRQKVELRRLLSPSMRQSLNVLALPLMNIRELVEQELENNPLLEELAAKKDGSPAPDKEPLPLRGNLNLQRQNDEDISYRLSLITKKASLQDILLRQLGMFTNTNNEFLIGQEIIGNIDDNGYLKVPLEQIAEALSFNIEQVENVLVLIQQFEPVGVGARTISECLLIQLNFKNETDPLLLKIVEFHLDDVAKKNYNHIAKSLKQPLEAIEPLIKKILKLDPKPGRNYTIDESQQVIPDIIIDEKGDDLEITINHEDIPDLEISKTYRAMLKNKDIDSATREFITQKLRQAQELLRSISKRQTTIRCIVEALIEVQQEAFISGLSFLKPLTFSEIAQKINMHESTVCRAVMNKYVKTPFGVVALKDFFCGSVNGQNGQSVSSSRAKGLIKEIIKQEDRKKPLSDQDISTILSKSHSLNIPRRTVSKYREELKLLSTPYRREH